MSELNGNNLVSAALVAVQGEMEAASFDAQNPFLRNRYASLGAIIETSRPVLAKHKLAVLQVPTTAAEQVQLTTRLIHESGQFLDCGTLGLPIGDEKGKSRAQVAGSIITYLRRYAWASVLGMYAEEDTDGENGERVQPRKNAPRQAAELPPPSNQPPPVKTPPEASQTLPDRPKVRVAALKRLKALPGESNENLVQHFLISRGWITPDQTVLNWPVFALPKSPEEMAKMEEDIQAFEMQMRQQDLEAEVAP
jgi:hypothetical protein